LPGGLGRHEPHWRGTERLDASRNGGQRVEDAHELCELALGPVLGAREDMGEVSLVEVRAEHEQPGKVELAGGQRVQECREASDETSGGNAAKGFVFGEAELINAVGVEARAGARAVNAARFDLAEVNEELGEQLVRATHEAAGSREELAIGEMLEPS
jgi:hypothetical protein